MRSVSVTDEPTWLLDPRWDTVDLLSIPAMLEGFSSIVVVASARGDEMESLGATIAELTASGGAVTVVTTPRADHVDADTLVFAPLEREGDTDAAVVLENSATLLYYPVGLWQCGSPDELDWSRLRTLAPTASALHAKAATHAQCARVIETVLVPVEPQLRARVDHLAVTHRLRAAIASPFDAMVTEDRPDPWQLDGSPYEQRRLNLVMACLGRDRYPRALDIGCATGQLSMLLETRADEVVGMDASAPALEVARRRGGGVRWVLGAAPNDIPDEDFDLIVLSEVAYFLDGPDLIATLRAMRRRLRRGGELVLADWRRPTRDIPLDGVLAHRQATSMLDLPLRAHYHDADLLIDIWGQPVSVHAEYGGHA